MSTPPSELTAAAPQAEVLRQTRPSVVAAWWLIAVSLAVLAVCQVLSLDGKGRMAFAQNAGAAGARGVFAFTGQLCPEAYGVFMVDVDSGTIWAYRYECGNDKLKLVAARDWRYDRYLEKYSTEPSPEFIQQQLDVQRSMQTQSQATPTPTP